MNKLEFISISDIKIADRARQEFGGTKMNDLIASIKEKGVIQPITIDQHRNLIAGERRIRASIKVGLDKIPALIRTTKDKIDAKECELIENLNRLDLTWQERAKLTKEIHELKLEMEGGHSYRTDTGGWSGRKTADLMGVSREEVRRDIEIAEAIEQMPELADCKTEKEARDRLKKLKEAVLLDIMKKKHAEDPTTVTNIERKAASNYRIGDALAGMEEVAQGDTTVGFIEVDPPYGIDLKDKKRREAGFNPDIDDYTEIDTVEYPGFMHRVADLTYRCAGKDCWMIFWFGPTWHQVVLSSLIEAGWKVDFIPAIWSKGSGQTNAPEVHLARTYEPFFICRKGNPVLRERGKANVFHHKPVAPDRKYHPTQRPLPLMLDLFSTFLWPRQVCMVPFLGSGVSLRAIYYLSALGFGWDLNDDSRQRFLLEVQKDAEVIEKMEQEVV